MSRTVTPYANCSHQPPQSATNDAIIPTLSVTGVTTMPTDVNPLAAADNPPSHFMFHWIGITLYPQYDGTAEQRAWHLQHVIARMMVALQIPDAGNWREDAGGKGYRKTMTGPFGIRVGLNPYHSTSERRAHLHVSLPGQFLQSVPLPALRTLMHEFSASYGIRCSRIDLCFDHCPFSVQDAWQAREAGNILCVAKARNGHGPYKLHTPGGGELGNGMQIGSRTSERFMRIYDEHGFVRTELEVKHRRASDVFRHLITGHLQDNEIPLVALGIVRDFVRFIDRQSAAKANDCALLPWWNRFIGSAPTVHFQRSRPRSTLADKVAWLQKCVSQTLYQVTYAHPDPHAFLNDLFVTGYHKMTAPKRAQLAQWQQELRGSP